MEKCTKINSNEFIIDTVSPRLLKCTLLKCSKLKGKGVTGNLLTWITSYLSDRLIKVILSGQPSATAPINASVPQGSVLGPLLFSAFIDDIGDQCENDLFLYVDDFTLFCEIGSAGDADVASASLNRDLEGLKIWADIRAIKLTFEPSKCKVLTISRKRQPTRIDLHFGNTKLKEVEELDILGVTIDKKMTQNKQIANSSARAGQRFGALRRIAPKLDVSERASVYKAQIHSGMEYASLC